LLEGGKAFGEERTGDGWEPKKGFIASRGVGGGW